MKKLLYTLPLLISITCYSASVKDLPDNLNSVQAVTLLKSILTDLESKISGNTKDTKTNLSEVSSGFVSEFDLKQDITNLKAKDTSADLLNQLDILKKTIEDLNKKIDSIKKGYDLKFQELNDPTKKKNSNSNKFNDTYTENRFSSIEQNVGKNSDDIDHINALLSNIYKLTQLADMLSSAGNFNVWTTATRPSTSGIKFGLNTDYYAMEYYTPTGWFVNGGYWTTATRPTSMALGSWGYNTTIGSREYWDGSVWNGA